MQGENIRRRFARQPRHLRLDVQTHDVAPFPRITQVDNIGHFVHELDAAAEDGAEKVFILSGSSNGDGDSAPIGTDVSFFVSGSTGDRGLNKGGISLFAGDVVISGSLTDGDGNPIAGGGTGTVTSGSFNEVSVTGEVNSFVTTASVSFAGASGFQHDVHEVGTDVYFFVSGTVGEGVSGATGGKKAVFGGDTFTSGNISGIKGFRIGTEYRATAPVQNTTGAIVSSNGLDSSLELISVMLSCTF